MRNLLKIFDPEELNCLQGKKVQITPENECPYLPDRVSTQIFCVSPVTAEEYAFLIPYGWRRCGAFLYKNICPDCGECRTIRIDPALFCPDRSQRRCLKKNEAISLHVSQAENEENFQLYRKYVLARHSGKNDEPSRDEYRRFLVERGGIPELTLQYRLPDGRLFGTAWCDLLPDALSAVYFAFDPEFSRFSPGVYSILRQIAICRERNLPHYYPGFYIRNCAKMNYKNRYRPCFLAEPNGQWILFAE